MLAVDDEGTVLIADDGGKMVRMLSIQDNKLSTVLSGMHEPWQCSFNLDFTNYYVLERRTSMRPLLFYGLYKSSNWQEAEAYYDQKTTKVTTSPEPWTILGWLPTMTMFSCYPLQVNA